MRRAAALALFLAIALLIAGCGGSDDDSESTNTAAVSGGIEVPTETTETTTDSQNPAIQKFGNIVSVYLGESHDGSFDPGLIQEAVEQCGYENVESGFPVSRDEGESIAGFTE